jgi:HJR/Mrr/RecB family endonuclease
MPIQKPREQQHKNIFRKTEHSLGFSSQKVTFLQLFAEQSVVLVSRECSIVSKLTPGLSHMMASTMYKEMTDTSKYTALLFLYLIKFRTVEQILKENTVTIHRV